MAYQSVTLEGWTYNMIYVEKALGWMSFCFFLPLIYIGAFFLLTLTLVVINSKFSEEHEANKQKKKMLKIILQREANKVDKVKEKEAMKALNRIKVKNKKIYMTKIDRKDSDDSLAQKKHFKTLDKLKREEIVDKINADLPPYSRTFSNKKPPNIRPIFGINDVSARLKANDKVGKETITEEFSNSQMSMINQNNIFYSFKGKTQGKETKDNPKKNRNVIIDNKTKRKVKMEGMYGISKAKNKDQNGAGSYSDLLEDIPLTDNDDEEVSNGTENFDPGSELMYPFMMNINDNSIVSESSKTGDKSNSKNKENNENKDQDQLCISEESMDIKDRNTNRSPGNATDASKNINSDVKLTERGTSGNHQMHTSTDDQKFRFGAEGKTSFKQKNTKFSAKIENGSDSPFTNGNALTELGGTITDFNIRAVLNMNLKNKNKVGADKAKETISKETQNRPEFEEIIEDNIHHTHHKKNEAESVEENLDDLEPDQIQIVKKGMKIFVKRNDKKNPDKDTVPADVLLAVPTEEDKPLNYSHHNDPKKIKKTYLAPYDIMREMIVNEQLLEGRVEKEVEDK